MKPTRVEISYKTIVFTVAFLLSLVLLWRIRDILTLFFVSLLFMEVLNPTVARLEKWHVPRTAGILLIYVAVIAIFSFAFAAIIPILITQTGGLLKTLPSSLQNLKIMGLSAVDLSSQFRVLEAIPSEIATTVISLFSNLLSGIIMLVVTFYLLLERKNLDSYSARAFSSRGQKIIAEIFRQLEYRLGGWINAQLILMLIIGVLSYLGYSLLRLDYALPLGLIAAIFEIVPTIGPIITTVIAGLIAITISPMTLLLTIIWGIFIHQLENNLIVPKVMGAAAGMHPIITIFAIAIGAQLGGIGGALLAIPIYITLETIAKIILNNRK